MHCVATPCTSGSALEVALSGRARVMANSHGLMTNDSKWEKNTSKIIKVSSNERSLSQMAYDCWKNAPNRGKIATNMLMGKFCTTWILTFSNLKPFGRLNKHLSVIVVSYPLNKNVASPNAKISNSQWFQAPNSAGAKQKITSPHDNVMTCMEHVEICKEICIEICYGRYM